MNLTAITICSAFLTTLSAMLYNATKSKQYECVSPMNTFGLTLFILLSINTIVFALIWCGHMNFEK